MPTDARGHIVTAVRTELEDLGITDQELSQAGLRITTTVDPARQQAAIDAALDAGWERRVLEVLNKADLLGGTAALAGAGDDAIAASALTGEGLDRLLAALDERLSAGMVVTDIALPPADGAGIAWLYQHGEVLEREDVDEQVRMRVRLTPADLGRFEGLH